ncbi:M14 family zinc carboxypeptidase [Haloglycomyces albus]|uniref:M14 family zinc carboxypeptidase n=1 Tax=Haloglycomyces albus TaxID=526067 RepID=UPI00046CD435|nr:M14 family zinc carboxypeptidase [Haloglycomyces albus]
MRSVRSVITLIGTSILVTTGLVAAGSTSQAAPHDEPVIWEVSEISPDEVLDLYDSGFDVAEYHDGTADVIGDHEVADALRDRGLEPQFHDTVYKPVNDRVSAQGTFYGGYKTPDLHLQHVDDVAAANPDLATVHDIGDSWLKTQGRGGYDIKAICLTNLQPGDCELSPDSDKPRFSLVSQIHARELATGEITWRWLDYLVDGYGTDSDITELLDTTEVWVVPMANPDGVDLVAEGGDNPVMHRKNANDSNGCSGTGVGVDLNRNHSYEWGDASSSPCATTYRGPSPASEPEIQALEGLFENIHPDQRGSGGNDPAPDDARDVMISLHSYGNYLIVPWGYTSSPPPNDDQLRELAHSMADHNGYQVGNAWETVGYTASGTTDDFAYGELGVAGYTFEIGGSYGSCGGFFPSYSCLDSTLWPENRDALMEAALQADAPYGGGGGGDPEPPEDCDNHDTVDNGSLASNGSAVHPDSGWYYSGASGSHQACLSSAQGTDFGLELQKWTGWGWTSVAQGSGSATEKSVDHQDSSGYFRWIVAADSGSGSYTLGYSRP